MSLPALTLGNPQFGRSCRIVVNDIEVARPGRTLAEIEALPVQGGFPEAADTGLDVAFVVTRHNRIEPNTTEVTIYNLSEAHRNELRSTFDALYELGFEERVVAPGGRVRVEAGYGGVVEVLAEADIVDLDEDYDGTTWALTITAQDGYVPWRYGFVSESIAPGVDASVLWNLMLSSWNASMGAEAEAAFMAALPDFQAKVVQGGMVLHGETREVVPEILESMKLKLSFQDGEIVLLPFEGATLDEAVELNPDTGLLGRPRFKRNGMATASALLNPKLRPGRQVRLAKADRSVWGVGTYRIDWCEHRGTLPDGDWISTVELRPTKLGAG